MLKAEYIAHMNAFRIYDEKRPQWTMVYADDKEEVEVKKSKLLYVCKAE